MPNNPTSFRLPFQLSGDVHPDVVQAIRYAFTGLKDLNDANEALTAKVNANTESVAAVQAVTVVSGSGGSSTVTVNVGSVNDQSGNVLYALQQTDFGALVIVETASPFALSLNSAVTIPFYSVVANLGTGSITATPTLGDVNGVATWTIPKSQFALIFYDGRNWWATPMPQLPLSIAAVTSKYLVSYDANTGIFVALQPSVHNLSDSTTGSGKVVLDSAATLIRPNLISPVVTGVMSIIGLAVYPSNSAAISGGLVPGNLYRLGADPDIIAIVH